MMISKLTKGGKSNGCITCIAISTSIVVFGQYDHFIDFKIYDGWYHVCLLTFDRLNNCNK
jgi:hypothetical protein